MPLPEGWEPIKDAEIVKDEGQVIEPVSSPVGLPEGITPIDEPVIETKQDIPGILTNEQRVDGILSKISTGQLSDSQAKAFEELRKRGSLKGATGDDFSISKLGSSLGERLAKSFTGEEQDLRPEKTEEISTVEALTKGVKALPSSAKNQLMSIWDAISQPTKTWEGLKSIAKDIYKNQMEVALKDMGFDPSEIKFKEGSLLDNIEKTPALDMIIDDLEKTYGSYEGFKEAVATDPARIIVDMGSVIAPVAKGAEAVAMAAKLPKVAKVAGVAAKGAVLSEPITAVATTGKQAISTISKLTGKAIPKLKPSALYQSATKMSTTLTDKERTRLSNIALESGIEPTIKGLDKIDSKIRNIDKTISDMIDKADLTGKTMPVKDLFKDFDNLKAERLLSAKPTEGVKSIDRIKKSILDANAKIKRDKFTPKEVQRLKQTIYKDIQGYYANVKNSNASIKAQRSVARAAKEYLEDILPEIKQLNKNDADLIALRNALDKPVSRIANRDIIGLGPSAKIGAAAVAGGAIGGKEFAALTTSAGLILGILDDPVVKSKIAILLNKLQKQGVKIPVDSAIRRLLAGQILKKSKEVKERER